MTQDNPFGEVVYSYTRKQAIEDGVLVDLSGIETIKEHWKYPFACTATVWAIIEAALQKDGQDHRFELVWALARSGAVWTEISLDQ